MKRIVFLSILLAIAGLATAQTSKREQAVALMQENRFEEAYHLLSEFHAENPDDIHGRFVLGMAALELGKNDEAIQHFEAILNDIPELPRVRLELARAYAAKGDKTEAKNEFKKVLETNPPPLVRENINRFLALLKEERRFHVWASIGYLYDDNVNAGPDTDYVTFFGLPFALDPGARQQSDSALIGNIIVDHSIPIRQDVDFLSTFGFRSTSYYSWSEFNSNEIVGSFGPLIRGKRTLIRFPFVFDYAFLGSEQYGAGCGLKPEWRYALKENLSVNASALWERKQYFSREDRTGYLWGVDIYIRRLLSGDSFLDIGYQHWREDTRVNFIDNDTDSVYAGFYMKLFEHTFVFIGPSVSWNVYEEREAAFEHKRDDVRTRLNLNLSKKLSNDLELAIGYTYTYNDSNLEIYNFRRNQLTIQLSKGF